MQLFLTTKNTVNYSGNFSTVTLIRRHRERTHSLTATFNFLRNHQDAHLHTVLHMELTGEHTEPIWTPTNTLSSK